MAAVAPEERISQVLADPAVEAGPGLKAAEIVQRLKAAYGLATNTSAVNSALYHGPFENTAQAGGAPLWRLKRTGAPRPARPILTGSELGFALWLEPGRLEPGARARIGAAAVEALLAAGVSAAALECDAGSDAGRAAAERIARCGAEKEAAAAAAYLAGREAGDDPAEAAGGPAEAAAGDA